MNNRTSVLVVDDEEHVRMVLEYNLKLDGFEVYLAADGPTSLELAREKRPDLILLDWLMPEMDGLEVLSELKHDKRTEDIPVFMVTAKGTMGDVKLAIDIGVDDYISKPFDPVELGRIIRKKLENMPRWKAGKKGAAKVPTKRGPY